MGNNFICDNYYCQDVSFKPEWFSETSWKIDYIHNDSIIKPYNIDKGLLLIKDVNSFNILLSKKLLIDFNETKNISIPINFEYNISNEINIIIIFSTKQITLTEIILNNNNEYFITKLKLINTEIFINDTQIKYYKKNLIQLDLENNLKLLYITEKLIDYEQKYFKEFNLDSNNDYYLNIIINSNNKIDNEDYLSLYFD